MHVGVASARQYVSIEERARRFGYGNKDFLGHHAPSDRSSQLAGFVDRQWSVDEGNGQLRATVSVADVATSITQLGLADVRVSDAAGASLPEVALALSCAQGNVTADTGTPEQASTYANSYTMPLSRAQSEEQCRQAPSPSPSSLFTFPSALHLFSLFGTARPLPFHDADPAPIPSIASVIVSLCIN